MLARDEPGYGFVATGVPELTLGVRPMWRSQGARHQRIGLSVERANSAERLRRTEGLVVLESCTDSGTVVKTLRRGPRSGGGRLPGADGGPT